MSIFSNRAGWAKTYLKKAGLVDSKKSYIKITKQGLKALEQSLRLLIHIFGINFSSFREFQYGNDGSGNRRQRRRLRKYPGISGIELPEDSKDLEADLLTNLKILRLLSLSKWLLIYYWAWDTEAQEKMLGRLWVKQEMKG